MTLSKLLKTKLMEQSIREIEVDLMILNRESKL